ncbi:MAG: hypothetical protein O6758_05935, partial [Planctomycetota bacterium]|nr:hypothetical protein [Planctomycetota bacterium]
VIAVRDQTKETILTAFETRLKNDQAAEMAEALQNIGLIARFRLDDMFGVCRGRLLSHSTLHGREAGG